MQQKFYSHGKLLISGEYAVLDGALALAVPTRFGQHMSVRENNSGILSWTSLDENGNAWFRELCGIRWWGASSNDRADAGAANDEQDARDPEIQAGVQV